MKNKKTRYFTDGSDVWVFPKGERGGYFVSRGDFPNIHRNRRGRLSWYLCEMRVNDFGIRREVSAATARRIKPGGLIFPV